VFQYSGTVTSEPTAEADPHDRLGAALRALADVVVRTGADEADLAAAADAVERGDADVALPPP
jgi:hypothetical protein